MSEPLALRGAIVAAATAVLTLIVLFVDIPSETQAAILGVVGSMAGLIVAIWSRGKVTPVDDPHDMDGNPLIPVDEEPLDPEPEPDWIAEANPVDDSIPGRLDWMAAHEDSEG